MSFVWKRTEEHLATKARLRMVAPIVSGWKASSVSTLYAAATTALAGHKSLANFTLPLEKEWNFQRILAGFLLHVGCKPS
jgi:hypothetical protein